MSQEVLWEMPAPATALMQEPVFAARMGRACELLFSYCDEEGIEKNVTLTFEGVESYKCTYMTSLDAVLIRVAYGKLVKLDKSDWLDEVVVRYNSYCKSAKLPLKSLSHLAICFDDGPSYEVICVDFTMR